MSKKKSLLRSKKEFSEKRATIMELLSIKNRLKDNADILAALANGFNPITGEEFGECVLDQPEILLALSSGSAALHNIASSITFDFADIPSKNHPSNAGKKWTQEDDSILLEAYNNDEPLDMLAKDFGRSEFAIIKRLEKLIGEQRDERIRKVMRNYKIRK